MTFATRHPEVARIGGTRPHLAFDRKSLSPKHLAADRAVKRVVQDGSGGISYADIMDRSKAARDAYRAKDEEHALHKALKAAGGKLSAKDVQATIGTSRKNVTRTGIR